MIKERSEVLYLVVAKKLKGNFLALVLLEMIIRGGQLSNGQETYSDLIIKSDYPGGNILVQKIESDTVCLAPDTKSSRGDWFYWYFSAISKINKKIHFIFPPRKIPTFGPAITLDQGSNWSWMYDQENRNRTSFTYMLEANKEVRFSMGFPYTQADFN